MSKKMKECFSGHALMHSLLGLGLGLLLASFFQGLANMWIGLILIAVAVVLDMMRKG